MSGAVELGAVQVEGMTRSAFILRGALACGAAYGASAVGPYVSRAFAQVAPGDIEVLSFALGLEQLEAAFYEAVGKKGGMPAEVGKVVKEFGAHEREHADVLGKAITQLGEKPAKAPKASFDLGSSPDDVLRLAVTLEETGVSAYNGAAPAITSADLLDVAGAIAQVEARHVGALRFLAGQDPAPAAFDEALTPQQVAGRVKQYVGSAAGSGA
jgi:rubrerythrin